MTTEILRDKHQARDRLYCELIAQALGKVYRKVKHREVPGTSKSVDIHTLLSVWTLESHPVLSDMKYKPYWLEMPELESDCDLKDPRYIEVVTILNIEQGRLHHLQSEET